MAAKAYMVPDLPDRAQRVHRLVDNLVDDPNSTIQSLALTALCLVESRREVEKRVQAAIGPVPKIPLNIPGLAACNEFLAGRLTEQQLLDTVAKDFRAQCYAHYTIGMMRLAERNREQAHQHFSECIATNMTGNFHYEMGRAYLERMEADPT